MTLKELREKAGLRQMDVSTRMDIDQTAVSHWESGKFRPSRKYHKKLAKLYGCTVEELVQAIPEKEEAL